MRKPRHNVSGFSFVLLTHCARVCNVVNKNKPHQPKATIMELKDLTDQDLLTLGSSLKNDIFLSMFYGDDVEVELIRRGIK